MLRAVTNYVQESIGELRHVSWPSRRDVLQHTAVIVVSVAVAMLIVAALDYGLGLLVDYFIIR